MELLQPTRRGEGREGGQGGGEGRGQRGEKTQWGHLDPTPHPSGFSCVCITPPRSGRWGKEIKLSIDALSPPPPPGHGTSSANQGGTDGGTGAAAQLPAQLPR